MRATLNYSTTETLLLLISRYSFLSPSGELSLRKATYIPSYSPSSREFPSPMLCSLFPSFVLSKTLPTLLSTRDHPYEAALTMSDRPHQAATGKVILPPKQLQPLEFLVDKILLATHT